MTRVLAWLTAIAAWGCMFYATALARLHVEQQGYQVAMRSRASAEYEITQIVNSSGLLTERTAGRFFTSGSDEWVEWRVNGRSSLLRWRVLQGSSMPIYNNEPVFLRLKELHTPLAVGMRLRLVRATLPTLYYLVIVEQRGEIVGVLEIIWHT